MSFIDEQKEKLKNEPAELAYASSDRYREKMAKELLGLKLSGEEVIILSSESQSLTDFLPDQIKQKENYELLTPSQKWLRYLFGI